MIDAEEDWPALAAHLARHGMHLVDPAPTRFTSGLANRNFLLHLATGPAVLRRPPKGPLAPGAHDMAREHRILSRLPDALLFVPRSLHLCEDPAILGAPFQILEYRQGLVIRDTLPPGLEHAGAALSETMVATLAAIHGADTPALGLDGLGRPEGFLARQLAGWRRRGTALLDGTEVADLAAACEWLDANAATDGPPALLHGDFKLDNMILHPDTLDVRGVVDWDQCTRGDPLMDLAVLLSYWTEPGDPPAMQALQQMPTTAPGFWSRQQAASRYAEITGRDLSGFRFHRVLGLVKLGVIFLQLGARSRTGATNDPRYAGFHAVGTGVLGFTREVAAGRVF